MSQNWRPNGWKNPWPKQDTDYASGITYTPSNYISYEAGADAMLKALFPMIPTIPDDADEEIKDG